ncbi:acetaldehyde dehydrogenase [Skermanella stibiiresistens SB22]|uniref:Acetaldehyde dehydrogenase n=1 Tax=Skermanella stibiiresistens SB22 TaxID=1385369 RepID=W9H4T9_9PROT|nr:acetaldehyde dehydrogenase [Skermanella stibiiresistens SB22]
MDRVTVTPEAVAVIGKLKALHGALAFHQSGGCCDGSAPMCFPAGEFKTGAQDIYLGRIEDCDFFIGAAQFEYWSHTQLIIDVVPGRGSGFSLEAPEGVRFLTRSRVFTDAEAAELEAAGPPPRGAD